MTTAQALCWHATLADPPGWHPTSRTPCDDPQPWPHPEPITVYGPLPYEGVWPGHGTRIPGAARPDNGQPWRPACPSP